MIDICLLDRIDQLRKDEERIRKEQKSIVGELDYSKDRLKIIYASTRAMAAEYDYSESKVREYFLFVALYVFDPTSIIRKMRKGLRIGLAEVLGVSENNVSHLAKHILFRYRHYRWFREDCDRIYNKSMELIGYETTT